MNFKAGQWRSHRRSHRTGFTGPDPTNFWDSNMGPPKFCSKVLIHYTMDPTIFSTPAAPLGVVTMGPARICGGRQKGA